MRGKVIKAAAKEKHEAKGRRTKGASKPKQSLNRPPSIDHSGRLDFMINPNLPERSDSSISMQESSSATEPSRSNVTQRSRRNDVTRTSNSSRSQRKQAKPQRRKSHVLKEILRLQNSTNSILAKAPFQRLVREIMLEYKRNVGWRITPPALGALQESAEIYLVGLFEDSYACTIHRGRVTLIPKDMKLVQFLRGPKDPGIP